MIKIIYMVVRDFPIFNFPGLRKFRNRIYTRKLNAGFGLNVDKNVRIHQLHGNKSSNSSFGSELHIGSNSLIDLSASVAIGNRVTISEDAKIFTHTHQIDDVDLNWRQGTLIFSDLVIEDDVWIGSNSVILSSVTYIGAGAIIAAGSVVTKNVYPATIVAGVPSAPIRKRRIL